MLPSVLRNKYRMYKREGGLPSGTHVRQPSISVLCVRGLWLKGRVGKEGTNILAGFQKGVLDPHTIAFFTLLEISTLKRLFSAAAAALDACWPSNSLNQVNVAGSWAQVGPNSEIFHLIKIEFYIFGDKFIVQLKVNNHQVREKRILTPPGRVFSIFGIPGLVRYYDHCEDGWP